MESLLPTMGCDICQRQHHPQRLPFLCAVDARNRLYEGRIANATILMEMTELEEQLNTIIGIGSANSVSSAIDRSSRIHLENLESEEQKARERTEQIIAQADKLRAEVQAAKEDLERRKASLARQKSDLATVASGTVERRKIEEDLTKKKSARIKYTWNREHEAMTHYRAALCTEVAKLYRLQRVRRGNPVRFEYKIGGIDIIDLHQLNTAQPEVISASLAHIAHLLWLAAHYLSIRLPAEITLPHNDYPRPTIFSLASSYNHGDVSFPGSSPLPPDPRDRQFHHVPHPRPLFIDKPVALLAKEDAAAYSSFLEAVCHLSYDIVWLCRTQGVAVGDNSSSFEDFCSMGRNLYNLLIGSSLQRDAPTQQIIPDSSSSPGGASSGRGPAGNDQGARVGGYSHGASHTFLGSGAGQEFQRSFKLPLPIKLADKLKARLVSETPVPEWELLEDDAWTPDDALDDGVLVGGKAKDGGDHGSRQHFGLESYMSVNTVRSAVPPSEPGKERERGTNGWMKIKPRQPQ